MNGGELLRRARRYARRNRQDFRFDHAGGKGSHGKLYIGAGRTVVKHGEISKGMLRSMLKQLGIEPKDLHGTNASPAVPCVPAQRETCCVYF